MTDEIKRDPIAELVAEVTRERDELQRLIDLQRKRLGPATEARRAFVAFLWGHLRRVAALGDGDEWAGLP